MNQQQQKQKFNNFFGLLFERWKTELFSISLGFELETNKMSLLQKQNQILYPLNTRGNITTFNHLSIGLDAPTSSEIKETNQELSKYEKLKIVNISDKTKKYYIYPNPSSRNIKFNHTEFQYLHDKNESTNLENLRNFIYQTFLEAVDTLNNYFKNFNAHEIFIFPNDHHRFINTEIGYNMILQNNDYYFIMHNQKSIDFNIQITIGCDYRLSIIIMMYLYKLYTPDCSLGSSFRDSFIFVCENDGDKELNVFTFLVIFLYNFLIHKHRGTSMFFIRTYMFEIFSKFDQNYQITIKSILLGENYIGFIRTKFPKSEDIVERYMTFFTILDVETQYYKQIQQAPWKTMLEMQDNKIFFEFRGFNQILKERLRLYPEKIKNKQRLFLHIPEFKDFPEKVLQESKDN